MSTVSGGPGPSVNSTSDNLSRARQLGELASLIAAEREAILGELEQSRRECEALRAQLSEVKAMAELKVRQCEILNAQLGELRAAAESEIARERERSKRESEAILSEARLVRARALETARRLDDCVIGAQKFACTLSSDLLSLSKVVAEARSELETDAPGLLASSLKTPPSLPDTDLDLLLGLSHRSPSVEGRGSSQGPGVRAQNEGEAVPSSGPSLPSSRVITVFSAKGGVGKTAISTNLAVAIKDGRSARVLLMDGDLQFGDAAVWLGLAPRIGIVELLESGGADDEMAIRSAVQEHESGVHVLLPPTDPSVTELVSPSAIRTLIETLRRMYDYVVIDTHTSYEDETLAMLDAADDILLVITPEVSVVRNTQTFLRICDSLGYAHKLIAVLNRANTGIRLDQLPDGIRKLVEVEAVSDGRTVVYSVNMGKPFVQQHKTLAVSQGITTLATFFAGRPNVTCRSGWKKALWPFISRAEKRNGSAAGALSR